MANFLDGGEHVDNDAKEEEDSIDQML